MTNYPKKIKSIKSASYPLLIMGLLFLAPFLSYTQVSIDSELEALRARYDKTIKAFEYEPKKCIPIYQELAPQFEKKQDWIYYYKCLIETAWALDFGGNNSQALQAIKATIQDYYTRQPTNYYQGKLADAFFVNGIILSSADQFDEAISSFKKAYESYALLEEGDAGFEAKEKRFSFCFNNISKEYIGKRDFSKALDYLEKAIAIKVKILGTTHKSTLRSIRSKGEIYIELGYFNQALDILEQVLVEFEKANEAEEIAKTQRGISLIYQRKKDFTTAEEYIRKSISIYDTLGAQSLNNKVYSLHQMGNVMKDGGRYEESINWFEQSIVLKNKISGSPNYDACFSTLNIGKAYAHLGKYEKSLAIYQQASDMFDQVLDKKHPKYVELWLSMGNCYLEDGQVEKAHQFFEQSYKLAKEKTPEKSFDRVLSCLNLARTTQDLDKALLLCQEGFWEVSSDFEDKDVTENPHPETVFSEFYMLRLLEEKATIFQKKHQQTQDKEELSLALATYQAASDLVDYARQSFFTESAKQFLAKHARNVYENGTAVAFQLFELSNDKEYTETAFQMMEKSRSLLLLEALQTEAAEKIAKIPDSLSFQKQSFRKELLTLETQFQRYKNEPTKAQALNASIFELKKEQQLFEVALAKNYPIISKIQKDLEVLTLSTIQSQLSKEETVVEFLVTNTALFVLKIEQDEVGFFQHETIEDLATKTTDFIGLVNNTQLASQQGAGPRLFQKFTEQSDFLYQNILADVLDGREQKLILIPDSYLNYLPFELLLTNKNFDKTVVNYADLPYLLTKSTLRYSFSANLQFQDFIPKNHNSEILAFAPAYEGAANPIIASRNGFSALTQTSLEVETVTSLLKGVAKIGPLANEKSFKALAANYGILHLAMHAYTNEEQPMLSGLIFSNEDTEEDGILHAYELYGIELNAQLAVLSACNTGSGKFEKGEGVMSLARGFRQAGVPNIVMSLWQADDKSTRIIMEHFYQQLKNGLSMDEALRQAKLDFLQNNAQIFPHYWSPFVLMGTDAPLTFIQSNHYWEFGIGTFLLLGFFFYCQTRIQWVRDFF